MNHWLYACNGSMHAMPPRMNMNTNGGSHGGSLLRRARVGRYLWVWGWGGHMRATSGQSESANA